MTTGSSGHQVCRFGLLLLFAPSVGRRENVIIIGSSFLSCHVVPNTRVSEKKFLYTGSEFLIKPSSPPSPPLSILSHALYASKRLGQHRNQFIWPATMIYTAIRTRLFDFLGFLRPALTIQLLVQKYSLGTAAIPLHVKWYWVFKWINVKDQCVRIIEFTLSLHSLQVTFVEIHWLKKLFQCLTNLICCLNNKLNQCGKILYILRVIVLHIGFNLSHY